MKLSISRGADAPFLLAMVVLALVLWSEGKLTLLGGVLFLFSVLVSLAYSFRARRKE